MFTGIISDIGEVVARDGGRFGLRSHFDASSIAIGASIACAGCCLTVTRVVAEPGGSLFNVDVSNETLARTTLAAWQPRQLINLERALRAGDELGGHIVSGHVDGRARVLHVADDGDSRRFHLQAPQNIARFIASTAPR